MHQRADAGFHHERSQRDDSTLDGQHIDIIAFLLHKSQLQLNAFKKRHAK